MSELTRRALLTGAAAAGVVGGLPERARAADRSADLVAQPVGEPDATFPVGLPGLFAHGVSSGDPLADRVILWTRVHVPGRTVPVTVSYEVRSDPAMTTPVVSAGSVSTEGSRDWTVKVDAGGLSPQTTYYYRFTALGETSSTGRTRTAVTGPVAELRFVTVSCASYWSVVRWDGMRRIAERDDIDLVLHSGDYVYDYPDEDEWVRARGRTDPATFTETDLDFRRWRTLAELRRRYALYRSDPDFLALHQQHPVFVLWDNHDLSTGDDAHPVPEEQVIQAFWEWTPTRPPRSDGSGGFPAASSENITPQDQNLVYRQLPYGPLADVRCLDVRHIASAAERADGHLLGSAQLSWLQQSMLASQQAGTAWRLVVNGYPFGQFKIADPPSAAAPLLPAQLAGGVSAYGAWDSFPAERARVVQFLRSHHIGDNLVLTGDSHGNFVWDVTDDDTAPGYLKTTGTGTTGSVGVEIQATSLGRGGATETLAATAYMAAHNGMHPYGDRAGFAPYLAAAPAGSAALSAGLVAANASMQYAEWDSHGYGIVHLTEARAVLELWWQPIRSPSDTETLGAQFIVPRGANHPTRVPAPTATSGGRRAAQAPPPAETAPNGLPEVTLPAGLLVAGVAVGAAVAWRRRGETPAG
jgi:alkaline phosphatase D